MSCAHEITRRRALKTDKHIPHCRANSKQTIAQIRRKAPPRSMCLSFSLNVIPVCALSGFLKKKKTVKRATPPNGRFIQKHHRQLARSVKTPPSNGPTTEDMPNILDSSEMYNALFLNATEKPMIVIPPEKRAAAPAPAMALPTMSMTEFLAAAQTIDPSSKMIRAMR